eukprot:scaffold301_cov243-Pinguiococcus_pyrenoidosus.AAC.46
MPKRRVRDTKKLCITCRDEREAFGKVRRAKKDKRSRKPDLRVERCAPPGSQRRQRAVADHRGERDEAQGASRGRCGAEGHCAAHSRHFAHLKFM